VEVAEKEDIGTVSDVEVAGTVNEVIVGVVPIATNSSAPISHAPLDGRVVPTMSQVKG
jgi:hypothetical protein